VAALRRWGIELRFTGLIVLRLGSNILPGHETLQSFIHNSPFHSTPQKVPLLRFTTSHRATSIINLDILKGSENRKMENRFATENTRITKRLEKFLPVKSKRRRSDALQEVDALSLTR
jgi:hypothetical protein